MKKKEAKGFCKLVFYKLDKSTKKMFIVISDFTQTKN